MRAIEIKDCALHVVNRAVPKLASGQVLLKIEAAGVNRPDIMQRKGLYPPPLGASDIPGLEVAGIVVDLKGDVGSLKLGDNVCALVTGGGYAEYCLAEAALCLPIPDGLSLVQASALPEAFFTVWSNVFDCAGLVAGEWLLVHGGTSGIGTTAIQLAKAIGAKVVVTAGNDAKCAFCLELGADYAINYSTQDFVEQIQLVTNNVGVNVLIDIVGADYFARNLKCLAYDSRLIQIGVQNGFKAEINLLALLLKRVMLTGSTLRTRSDEFKSLIAKKLLQKVWPLLANETIKPIIHSVFAFEEAAKAHELMESSQHIGKIVLKVNA